MLYLVPLACAGREVAHRQFQADPIGQVLQHDFPQVCAVAVAAPAVGGDEQFGGAGEALGPHFLPPATNAGGREVRGVMIDTYADPTLVVGNVLERTRES